MYLFKVHYKTQNFQFRQIFFVTFLTTLHTQEKGVPESLEMYFLHLHREKKYT